MPEKLSAMRNSDDLSRSSDSARQNHEKLTLEQYNSISKQNKIQLKSCEKIDIQEHEEADLDLEKKLQSLGMFATKEEIKKK